MEYKNSIGRSLKLMQKLDIPTEIVYEASVLVDALKCASGEPNTCGGISYLYKNISAAITVFIRAVRKILLMSKISAECCDDDTIIWLLRVLHTSRLLNKEMNNKNKQFFEDADKDKLFLTLFTPKKYDSVKFITVMYLTVVSEYNSPRRRALFEQALNCLIKFTKAELCVKRDKEMSESEDCPSTKYETGIQELNKLIIVEYHALPGKIDCRHFIADTFKSIVQFMQIFCLEGVASKIQEIKSIKTLLNQKTINHSGTHDEVHLYEPELKSNKRKLISTEEVEGPNQSSEVRLYYQHQARFLIPAGYQVGLSIYKDGNFIKTESIYYDSDIRFEMNSINPSGFYPCPPQPPVIFTEPVPYTQPVPYTEPALGSDSLIQDNQLDPVNNDDLYSFLN